MAKATGNITNFSGGIADSIKQGTENTGAFMRSVDYRPDARRLVILPKTSKASGNLITDLPVWGERINSDTYIYGGVGNLYKLDTNGVYTLEHTAPDSTGNGLAYFGEDKYLYYANNTTIGRWGQQGSTNPQWYDNFLGSEGGVPTNTYSLNLASASSQYATAADSASLSITGNLSLEAYVKLTTLPTVGNTMTIISKWDESGATRSYLFDIKGVSNFFGDGADGALTIAADTTDSPIDSACSGTVDTYTLSATNASFAAGQAIMIHQTQGTNAGVTQYTSISSYTAGTITTADKLKISFSSTGNDKAQVLVMKRYTNVTVNTGKTWTAKAWNGTTGGILAFYANGTSSGTGTISATGKGYRGGAGGGVGAGLPGTQGEGENGVGTTSIYANGLGGGGAYQGGPAGSYGAGGGYSSKGSDAANGNPGYYGDLTKSPTRGGGTNGSNDLTMILFGGGGGGGATGADALANAGTGGAGGGAIVIFSNTWSFTGTVISKGNNGGAAPYGNNQDGGPGAGGSILIKADVATLGTNLVTSIGGTSANGTLSGGNGRIHLDYATSYTGTTTPTLDVTYDSSINTSDGHQLRLGISSDGTTEEFFTQTITGQISTGDWARWSVTWDSLISQASFYRNGVLLGQKYGTFTSISDNASLFSIGANKGASAYGNFLNGKIDDVRVYNTEILDTDIISRLDTVLVGNEANLVAYYKLDNAATDATSYANNLTLVNSPSYILNDVPFSGVTVRQDQDQTLSATGNTYTLPTSISETSTNRQTFVPARDPQKSIRVYISAKGTGNWTMTIHDALNREIASKTVANTSLNTGFYEFVFTSWRPIVGASYHFHLTSTVADGTIRTQTASDMETCDYATFYQFLVNDAWHPMKQMLNLMAIGNERYLATYDGLSYDPMRLTLPAGYRIRSLAYWREYLCIGTWRGEEVTDYDEGKIFFWDGISDTYNFFIDVPEGSINAMQGTKGKLYIIAGYSSDLLLYMGGDSAQKIKRIPNVDISKYVEVYPGAMTMWRTLIHVGIAAKSDSDLIQKGVYTWGSLNRNYDDSLNYDYPISTGTRTGTDTRIGMVIANGRKLLIGWNVGTAYGVDEVDPTGACFTTATYESLVEDAQLISAVKLPLVARADFEPLIDGQSVSIKYKVDRESTWTSFTESTVGATYARLPLKDRVREIQIGIDMETSTTSPTLLGISLENDNLASERQI